jgi:hypothetical protein
MAKIVEICMEIHENILEIFENTWNAWKYAWKMHGKCMEKCMENTWKNTWKNCMNMHGNAWKNG